jgi:hypothetical protein
VIEGYGGASRDRTDDLIVANDGVSQINSFPCSRLDAEYGPLRSNSTNKFQACREKLPHSFSGLHPSAANFHAADGMLICASMLFEFFEIVASNLRFVECGDNLRARHNPVFVKQIQAGDESELFAKLSAFGHSRPRAFRADLSLEHSCTDISAIDYEIGSKYLKTLIDGGTLE